MMISEIEDIVQIYKPRKKGKLIIIAIISLISCVVVDGHIFRDTTITTIYIPLMILVGFLARYLLSNIILSGLAATAIEIFSPEDWMLELFLLRWLGFLSITLVVRHLITNRQKETQELINFTITLAETLDARDKYTAFHSKNVAYYSYNIGKALRLSNKECSHLYIGGLLHDIGKIGISESILNKPSRLTEEEYNEIKKHPEIGYKILEHVTLFRKNSILDMVLYHHEKFDGTGYPSGLKGENIPLVARIMAVADAFDAMTSRRIYRDVNDTEYALKQLSDGKHNQFDPKIADVFLELIKTEVVIIQGFVSEQ